VASRSWAATLLPETAEAHGKPAYRPSVPAMQSSRLNGWVLAMLAYAARGSGPGFAAVDPSGLIGASGW